MMNENKSSKKSILSSRKFKYGSVAIAFTVIFCAFIILLNVVLTVISDRSGGFYLDLTSEKIYDLSQNSIDVIKNVDKQVDIIFCVTEDKIDDSNELSYVKRLAEKYCGINDKISIVYKDYLKDPIYFEQFKKNGTSISNTSVIVSCEDTKASVVYRLTNFFKFSSETGAIFGYDGENKITSAIMQTALNADKKAGYITRHGEKSHQYLTNMLVEQGYDVSEVDLSTATSEELAKYNFLIICEPTLDYSGVEATKVGGVNEIDKLDRYLKRDFGNLMVFLSPDTPQLAELSGYLSDTWGVGYIPGSVISEGSANAVTGYEGLLFYATPTDDGGYGSKIHKPITDSGVDRTAFLYTVPLTMQSKSDIDVSAVFRTSSAALRSDGESYVSAAGMPVMTLSKYFKFKDNVERSSNVLVCGASRFLNYIDMPQYANKDILKVAFTEMGDESVVTGIDFKVAEDTTLEVSTDEFKDYVLLLSTVVPIIIAVIGVVVFIRRKKS